MLYFLMVCATTPAPKTQHHIDPFVWSKSNDTGEVEGMEDSMLSRSSEGASSSRSGSLFAVDTVESQNPSEISIVPSDYLKYIEHIDGDEWAEVLDEDDEPLPAKILEYCDDHLQPEEKDEDTVYDICTPGKIKTLKNGSFCENVWAAYGGDDNILLYVIKSWREKSSMSALQRRFLSESGSLSAMEQTCLLTTREVAFERLAKLKASEAALKTQDAFRVLLPNRLLIINHSKYIEVIEGAHGVSLQEYILKNSAEAVTPVMKEVGRRFARFHKEAQAVHGDAGPGNVFWDLERDQYSLIDCQSVTFVKEVSDSTPAALFFEEVETFVSYLKRGSAEHSECAEHLCLLRQMSGGLAISDELKHQYAQAFVDGYIEWLGDSNPELREMLVAYRQGL